jgi:pyridoxamine 5'-phosphate oxidase
MASLRDDYLRGTLDERPVDPDPIRQFERWFEEAENACVPAANAMALATADSEGAPSARMVLLKGCDRRGFVFYTNYESRKGRELAANPRAALCFYWEPLERQVRITGEVERTTAEESDEYFQSRPEGSRFSAAASPQSAVVADRAELENKVAKLRAAHPDGLPSRPANWGGFRLIPDSVEFWQGRRDRLHDRITYRRREGEWLIERLAP